MKQMKKIISMVLILIMSLSLFTMTVSANEEIKVFVNGQQLQFDVPPQMVNHRTMVPLRVIFEALGAKVEWYENPQAILVIKSDGQRVVLWPGYDWMQFADRTVHLGAALIEVNGRTLVPVRAISEAFGADVGWNEATQTVTVNWKKSKYLSAFENVRDMLINKGTKLSDGSYMCSYEFDEASEIISWSSARNELAFATFYKNGTAVIFAVRQDESKGVIGTINMDNNMYVEKILDGKRVDYTNDFGYSNLSLLREMMKIQHDLSNTYLEMLECNVKMSDFGINY